jgi:uncharacterized protein YqfB (UPF0267 family)
MEKKTIKFRDFLIPLVLSGEKNSTWRLFDDKDLQVGDEVDLINWNTKEKFADAFLTEVREKELGTLEAEDFEGHEKFESEEAMYESYKTYYGEGVTPHTSVKIIRFTLK